MHCVYYSVTIFGYMEKNSFELTHNKEIDMERCIKLNDIKLNTALEVIKNYNYNLKRIILIAKNSIKRFNKLLARTYAKAERDWKKEHMISEFYNFYDIGALYLQTLVLFIRNKEIKKGE